MHASLQPGDRSPKQVNTPSSTVQLKPGCDSGQNSGTTFPAQVKGKKRDRADHGADSVKRERSSRANDEDCVQFKPGINFKAEIARITEKGGVTDVDGVEKLIQLMQSDRMERNRDLLNRSMLAGVMAATDKVECLNRFVQLRGLPVLDEWLQEIHKGKIGDGNNLKDGDKSVEEFVLVLLGALDKLPVDLHALQTCNIGRSVNHLRSHKNLEIQRKARSLVDTWKKRVEAEMNSIDTKSGSAQAISVWPSKSRLPEASHGVSKTPSGSDVALKSSATQNYALKTTSTRPSHGDSNIKSSTSSPGPLKSSSSPASGKESQPRVSSGGTPDVPLIREDMSSSFNQSNNCCQSFSGKEDGRSSSAGLLTVNKISTSTIRTRKNSGIHGVPVTGIQKETSSSRGSLAQKTTVLEKSQAPEGPKNECSSHKLIVTISNQVRSPAHGVSGESLEDPGLMSSRASSPALLDKHEQFEHTSKDNTDLWQNDSKDLLTGSGEGAGSPVALPEEERSVTTDDSRRLCEGIPKNQLKTSRSQVSSFSPMNALIESCAKYSGANSSLSLEDDGGMNLLASVAAGEMSRSDLASPTDSTEISTPAVEENCGVDEEKSKSSPENYMPAVPSKYCIDADNKQQSALECSLVSEDGFHVPKKVSVKFTGDNECAPSHTPEDVHSKEGSKHLNSSSLDSRKNIHHKLDTVEKSNVKIDTISTENVMDGKFDGDIHEDTSRSIGSNGILNRKTHEIKAKVMEEKAGTVMDEGNSMTEFTGSKQLCEGDNKKDLSEGSSTGNNLQQKFTAIIVSGFAEKENSEKLQQTACGENSVSKGGDEVNFGKSVEKDSKNFIIKSEMRNFSEEVVRNADVERQSLAASCSGSDHFKNQKGTNVESKKMLDHESPSERGCSVDLAAPQKAEFKSPKSSSIQTDEGQNRDSVALEACSSAAGQTHTDSKIKFDLNEGFSADDGKYGEPVSLVSSGSTNVHIINSVPLSVNSVSAGNSASITVAAAAKGPFVPPDDLVRSKGELGWKGSAATSAFRPAEPRKFLETAFGSMSNVCSDASISKQGRIPLDFDLNVPDERVLEEIASRDSAMAVGSTTGFVSNHATLLHDSLSSVLVPGSGGLDLDLNRVDEATEIAYCSTSNYQKVEGSIARIKPLGGLPTGDGRRDFDLNDGPIVDNASADQFSIRKQVKGGISSQLHPPGLRMNSPGVAGYSSWFPPGNTYSTVTIPTILPDRGDPPFPVFPPGAPQRAFGVTPLTPDVYRGSVLSSSPAVPFSSSPFQFSVFPFGTTFPLPSSSFSVGTNYADSSSGPRLFAPPVNSQFLGQVGPVASQFQRPYVVNLPDGSSNGMLENNRKWGRQGLDLNAGPGAMEEVREDSFAQHPVASTQVVVEEQARMYPVPGGISKRKEPEGGWDNESFRYKQFSWQ